MVTTFVRLKLRLLRNGLATTQGAVGFVVALILGSSLVSTSWISARQINQQPDWIEPTVIVACALLPMAWLIIPLLVGATDGTVDPNRLAHLPINRRQMIMGLLAAAVAGVMPVVNAVSLLSLVMLAKSVGATLVILLTISVLVLLCVTVSQIGSLSLSSMLRGRRSRDIATAILGALAISGGLFFQVGFRLADNIRLEQMESTASVLRWTPGGWLGTGIAAANEGRYGPAALAIIGSMVFLALLAKLWSSLLNHLLSSSETRQRSKSTDDPQWPRFLPLTPIRSVPIRTATIKTLLIARRDPRSLAGLAAQLPLLLIVALPAASLLGDRANESVLLAGGIGLYGGLTTANMFGLDGRAVWLDLLSAPSIKSVLWGKTLAHALLVAPLFGLAVLGLAIWTGGWEYLIPAIGLAVAGFGAMVAAQVITSVRFPVAAPEGSNPWAGNSSGAGMVSSLMLLISMAVGFLLAVPASALITGLSLWQPVAGTIAAPFAILWGAALWTWAIRSAAARVDNDPASLFTALAVAT